jgi:serine/threonine protein kinase/WD40 repeat protein
MPNLPTEGRPKKSHVSGPDPVAQPETGRRADTDLGLVGGTRVENDAAGQQNAQVYVGSAIATFEGPPELPNYKLRSILGQGGMGIVYRAEQTQLHRSVAIKMLSTPGKPTEEQLTRFHAEAAALARLRHPNIVEIYDYGEWNTRPFFVMELVEGSNLADLAEGKPQPPEFAARLMMIVARAVQAFHEKGILHRDIKPGNVLLQILSLDDPDRSTDRITGVTLDGRLFIPKITDFGVAKDLLAEQKITRTGTTVGTPQYMAPEQAESEYQAIGPATDIYGIGASLYELLTGLAPIRGSSPLEILAQIATHVPAAPSFLQPGVPRDLDIICNKCLEKLPTRRYASAQALAEDLQAFLEGRPIKARPASSLTRTIRWCRRRPLVAAFAGLSAVLAIVLIASLASYNSWLGIALKDAKLSAEESQHRLVELYTISGMRDVEEGFALSGMVWFTEALKQDRGKPEAELRHRIRLATTKRQAPELRDLWGGTERISAVAVNAAAQWVAVAENTGRVRLWNLETHQLLGPEVNFDQPLKVLRISGNGHWVAGIEAGGTVRLWQPKLGSAGSRALTQSTPFDQITFHSGGELLVLHQTDGGLKLWNLKNAQWQPIPDWPTSTPEQTVISPDGRHSALVSKNARKVDDGQDRQEFSVQVWETEEGPGKARVIPLAGIVLRVALNKDGSKLAIMSRLKGANDAEAVSKVWIVEVATGQTIKGILPHKSAVIGFVFDPTGDMLLTASSDHRGRIWNARTAELRGVGLIHRSDDVKVAFSQHGRLLATGGIDNQARIWDLLLEEARTPPLPHQGAVRFLAFVLDDQCLLTADDFTLRVWKIPVPNISTNFAMPKPDLKLKTVHSRDGKYFVKIDGPTAQVVDAATNLPMGAPLSHAADILYAVFSPTGEMLATTSEDNTARVWNSQTGELINTPLQHEGDVLFAAFSPDSSQLVTTSQDRTARLWDIITGQPLSPSWQHESSVVSAVFRTDRLEVMTSDASGRTFAWDISPDSRPVESIELWAQVMSGTRFVKNHGLVPFGARGQAESWHAYRKQMENHE